MFLILFFILLIYLAISIILYLTLYSIKIHCSDWIFPTVYRVSFQGRVYIHFNSSYISCHLPGAPR